MAKTANLGPPPSPYKYRRSGQTGTIFVQMRDNKWWSRPAPPSRQQRHLEQLIQFLRKSMAKTDDLGPPPLPYKSRRLAETNTIW